jgi:hypothetical protein
MPTFKDVLQELINYEVRMMRLYKWWTMSLFFTSILLMGFIIWNILVPGFSDWSRMLYGLLGIYCAGFVCSLSVYPLRALLNRRARIRYLQTAWEILEKHKDLDELHEGMEPLFLETIERITLGGRPS